MLGVWCCESNRDKGANFGYGQSTGAVSGWLCDRENEGMDGEIVKGGGCFAKHMTSIRNVRQRNWERKSLVEKSCERLGSGGACL